MAAGTPRTTAAEVAGLLRADELLVAQRGADVVGCVRVRPLHDDVWELGMLAVAEEVLGSGAGTALVHAAERRAAERGAATMQLEVLVPTEREQPSKTVLDRWYRRIGYGLTSTGSFADEHPGLAEHLAVRCEYRIYRKALLPARSSAD